MSRDPAAESWRLGLVLILLILRRRFDEPSDDVAQTLHAPLAQNQPIKADL